jgi:hypothetical protein
MWIFIATDLALLGAAALIAAQAPRPFSEATMLWIVGCVMAGIFLGLVPIIWRFERLKNEALDDRQRALEALARTISSSAEQISIATGGLHEIAELAQKNLRHADHLPQKLQEKIAEFQAQLAQANDTDREELERELLALRTSESERLDSVSQRIAKATAEWAKLESATAHHLTTASETLAKISLGTASAIGQAQAAAEQALTQARIEAARTVGEASGHALKALESARTAALSELATKLTGLTHRLADDVAVLVVARIADSTAALAHHRSDTDPAPAPPVVVSPSAPLTTPPPVRVEPTHSTVNATSVATAAATEPSASVSPATQSEGVSAPSDPASNLTPAQSAASVADAQTQPAPAAKRPRKPRREAPPEATNADAKASRSDASSEPTNVTPVHPASESESAQKADIAPDPTIEATVIPREEPAAGSTPISPSGAATVAAAATSSAAVAAVASQAPEPTSLPTPVPDPAFVSAPESTPVSIPSLAKPVAAPPTGSNPPNASLAPSAQSPTLPGAPASVPTSEESDAAKSTLGLRKRTARRNADDDTPALDLGLDDTDFGDAARHAPTERVMTSDGATRLLITAYIGIGNRLFIRGDGPGLSWEKGVPLSFISIGKWRWETNDAVQPISFKLYKNDELECSALGKRTLDPGYQQEVTAAF